MNALFMLSMGYFWKYIYKQGGWEYTEKAPLNL